MIGIWTPGTSSIRRRSGCRLPFWLMDRLDPQSAQIGKMLRYGQKKNGVMTPFSEIAEEGLEPPTRGL